MDCDDATVLLIDDESEVRAGISRLLRAVGWKAEVFASAEEFMARLPFTGVRLAFGSMLRSLLYLLGKDLRRAGDEIAAITSLLTHPGRIMASRRRVAATSTLTSRAAVHDLRPGAWSQARSALEALAGIVAAGRTGGASSVGAIESGPVSDDADIFEDPADGFVRRSGYLEAAEANRISRDYDVLRQNYEKLLQDREQLRTRGKVEDKASQFRFDIIQQPSVPQKPAAPNRPLLLFGVLIVGLGAGVAAAYEDYFVEAIVRPGSRLAGASVEDGQAGGEDDEDADHP